MWSSPGRERGGRSSQRDNAGTARLIGWCRRSVLRAPQVAWSSDGEPDKTLSTTSFKAWTLERLKGDKARIRADEPGAPQATATPRPHCDCGSPHARVGLAAHGDDRFHDASVDLISEGAGQAIPEEEVAAWPPQSSKRISGSL